MAVNRPTGIPAPGKLSLVLVPFGTSAAPGIANTASPKLTEINGSSTLNFSCFVQSDGYARTPERATSQRRRICEETATDVPGTKTMNFDPIKAVCDPQDPTADVSKFYVMCVEGAEFWIVERIGKDGKTDIATGDYVDLYRVRCSLKNKLVPGDEGEIEFEVTFTNIGDPVVDALVAA